jgi:hypothetical protein
MTESWITFDCTLNGTPLMARIPVQFIVKNPAAKLLSPPPEGVVGESFDWTMQFNIPVSSIRQLTPLPPGLVFDGVNRIQGAPTAQFNAPVEFEVL